jgi:streptogramin lyase
MSPILILVMTCVLVAGMLSSGQTAAVPDAAFGDREMAPPMGSQSSSETPPWTTWGANQYALADDGAYIWIGATGGVVRWDKQQHSYRRYSAVDGLPHTAVLAVAVDAAGNRWFGGDRGLSRLDAEEGWTHFRAADSGLYSDRIDGIAVVGGDTLYLSHGLPGGSVSRRDGDGAWRWFPNRETVIQADYAAIVQTPGSNPLWAVAGNEVWAGSRVFDGERWYERKLPAPEGEPVSLAVDSRNHVWALSGGWTVYEWDGAGWLSHPVEGGFSGAITALAVDNEDRVWIGLQVRSSPYSNEIAGVRELAGDPHIPFTVAGPVAALLVTSEGLWAVGPGWLMLPDLTVTVLNDIPRFQELTDALLGADGSIWLYSRYPRDFTTGAVQILDDRGTLALEDDVWQVRPADYLPDLGYCERVTAFEREAGGVWYASFCYAHFSWPPEAMRYHGGQPIKYPLPVPWYQQVGDIFAQDQSHIWFATWGVTLAQENGYVLRLDDGGTPADTGDDVWQTYPVDVVKGRPSVAVDALDRLWLGQGSGLYRYDGSSWRLVYGTRPICDLAPAADGTLYAQVARYGLTACEGHSDEVLVVRADGTVENSLYVTKDLIDAEPATVGTAQRRNSLWTIGPDGAIWYVSHDDPGQELQRRSSSGLRSYALPVEPEAVQQLEVDRRGHVWLVAGSQLWRLEGPRPIDVVLPMVSR